MDTFANTDEPELPFGVVPQDDLIEALRVPIKLNADGQPEEWVVDLHDAHLQAESLVRRGIIYIEGS